MTESPHEHESDMARDVGRQEARRLRSRRARDRTVWFGLGMFGIVGWSVAVPAVLGTLLGLWLDRVAPVQGSWALMLLVAGLGLGCLHAWYWLSRERDEILSDGEDE